jgi:hypothetical protein
MQKYCISFSMSLNMYKLIKPQLSVRICIYHYKFHIF